MHLSVVFLLAVSCFGVTYGYSNLRRQIPNGFKVPHPCGTGTWDSVGHMAPQYDPAKNAFGKDVREILVNRALDWSKVCHKDSDGDGYTNGQELGDPDCKWKISDGIQGLGDPMGHPGICEPSRQQCTSGVTFNECPNPKASGAGGPRITVPPGANDHPQTHLSKGTGPFSGGESRQIATPNFGTSDGFGRPGGFGQSPSGGSFTQPPMSDRFGGASPPGFRGSAEPSSGFGAPASGFSGFSGPPSSFSQGPIMPPFAGQRPSFGGQSSSTFGGSTGFGGQPDMGGHTDTMPQFAGQRPSFGGQSSSTFGGSTGFGGQPDMGGHTDTFSSDHSGPGSQVVGSFGSSSESMGMPDFNAAGAAGFGKTGPGFAPSAPQSAGPGGFSPGFPGGDFGAPMGFDGGFSGVSSPDMTSEFGSMGGSSSTSPSHGHGGSSSSQSGFGPTGSEFSGFSDPSSFSMGGPPRGSMSFRPGSMPDFMRGGHLKPGFGSSLSSDVVQRSVQSRLDQERSRMGGSAPGTSFGHRSASSRGSGFDTSGMSSRFPGLRMGVPMFPPMRRGPGPMFFA